MNLPALKATRPALDELAWDLRDFRRPTAGEDMLLGVASRLPFFVPRTGLLLLDWQCGAPDAEWAMPVLPRIELHSAPFLTLPGGTVRPTGATVHVEQRGEDRQLMLQMPVRQGRPGARLPLATGLMRLSMQAHDQHRRFLPVVQRTDLTQDGWGDVALHLHTLDAAALAVHWRGEAAERKALVANLAERMLALMGLPGAGLARGTPMLLSSGD
jgi:hypothetical protein